MDEIDLEKYISENEVIGNRVGMLPTEISEVMQTGAV